MELLMPAAIAAQALGYVSAMLTKIPVPIAGLALEGIAGAVRGLGGLRIADLRVPTPGIAVIVLAAASIALAMILVRRHPDHGSATSTTGMTIKVARFHSAAWTLWLHRDSLF
jgi:hypothetical protein